MIEDTTFIIDVLHDDRDAIQYLDLIERENRPEKVSSITVLELYEAVPQLNAPEERRQAILDVLDTCHAVVADETVMRKAGKISGSLRARDEEIDREDCIIGATALLNDEPVVTRNHDHFERIDGLDVETY
ncbi:PIN domain-containing protein [Halorubrum lacusprofundi]|jgi:predicted nucleic acid-binding protein|uniref:Ribonuclease VapC n=1 Tax=Halorubrum lacusprofundi (strain ATCC 49239 / DSM 5036 / JCM 8891 / ACAM 34) TaxID=416348 RepID=B9LNT3_HALLT|nr:PIN domain-containing protein [Halorubrum lacusprofundi]ACM57021.1 PilT protein domain protein [Halorubrum lacusprofundi ATCC 49239]MCG1007377.1 PIN domain-containing protein [Halorubrum lacusprofundi]